MKRRVVSYPTIAKASIISLLLIMIGWILWQIWGFDGNDQAVEVSATEQFSGYSGPLYKAVLPSEEAFQTMAENNQLKLTADRSTGHFQIIDKLTGDIWRSYPNPEHWQKETATGTWKNHLLSPILIEYVNASNYKSASVTAGLVENGGYLEEFQLKGDGFKVTFAFPKTQFKIPIEVTLHEDYVETKLMDDGIIEGELSLLNVKLYPLFGAEPSQGQEGYIMLPDGSGSLIHFDQNRIMPQLTYNESVYGPDQSYYSENTNRQRIAMPVFGMKSGEQAFLAIVSEGEYYANIYAAPGGSVGSSNWVTTEWQYRKRFFQSVSRSTGEGFYTYSGEAFEAASRSARYYPLTGDKSNYAGMAEKYRDYLMSEKGIEPLQTAAGQDIPLFLDIVGADAEKGLLFDSYLKVTTTDEATKLVNDIHALGISNMQVQYSGWQQEGYSSHGDYFPVDRRIGGNSGMRSFIEFAHSLNIPVYLTANYTRNTDGNGGFWWRRDGLRNLAGTVLEEQERGEEQKIRFVSPEYYEKEVYSDLADFKELGADGIYFENGIGEQVNTDFNTRYMADRSEVVEIQKNIFKQTKETLGSVIGSNSNFYLLDQSDHVHLLSSDYSYDVFVSESIPFAQIVLHGLRSYTLEWSNTRDEWQSGFLQNMEYGAYPSYILSGTNAENTRQSYSLWQYSLKYDNWTEHINSEYQKLNEALKEVQNRFITGHRTLASGVKETVYEGGYRILVNYNDKPYDSQDVYIPAQDFIVEKSGDSI